jgi:DNA repair protein RecO (recombination protein O)
MHLSAAAIVCAARHRGETGVVVHLLTEEHGLVGAFVAGGRGRQLRPVLIPGNQVAAELTARPGTQLPSARLELMQSRGPWLTEPLPAAAMAWVTALTAATLPERQAYPPLYAALAALLDAICSAPSARGWASGLLSFEALLLRELGYGMPVARPDSADWHALLTAFDQLGTALSRYPLAERRSDVMAARAILRERLGRI